MTSTETTAFDVLAVAARPLRSNLEHRDRANSMLRWLSRLALCSMLYQCGSSNSEGLFDSEAGASAPGSTAAAPDVAASPSVPASSEPLPAEESDAEEREAPRANEPAPTPASPAGEPAASDVPAAISVIQIERARWDEDDGELEVRGVVSSPAVTLSVRFLARTEPLLNEDGSFRGEFSAVDDNPEQVTVTASDGASANARVEVD
jgi:hypothetical protein